MSDPTPTFPAGLPIYDALSGGADRSEILIITGMSGAGRSLAAGVLEDLGWYVVDNLPPQMIAPLAGMMGRGDEGVWKLAVVVDVRSGEFFQTLIQALEALRQAGTEHRMIFLDTSDEVLVKRYESVRRPHPLQGDGSILTGIQIERELLNTLRDQADSYLDTSEFTVHDLTERIARLVDPERKRELTIAITSFGFKNGLPMDANNVFDVRFLANPYWVDELRHLTGRDAPVKDYVMGKAVAQEYVERLVRVLAGTLPGYVDQRRHQLAIAVGCTGGRHRSVAVAEAVAAAFKKRGLRVRVTHRDVDRP